jgi:5-methylcytosine-specific restriction endonuclease McrA
VRLSKVKRKQLEQRAEKRVAAKARRITQERNARRSRRSIDRAAVFGRDRGVCAECGIDTDKLARWLAELPRWSPTHGYILGRNDRFVTHRMGAVLGRHHGRALTLLGRLWDVRLPLGARLWEADHRLPIAEGGSDEFENLRTLCRKCHTLETAALKARLARRPTKAVGRGF